jgi:macrolide transport system ATP-binding/permease protein
MITDLWQDLRYGARMMKKTPGFTSIAVATLALGIGVNTTLFTGFDLLLRPLPVKDPNTIVSVERQSGDGDRNFSFPDYEYIRDHAQTFSDVLADAEEKFLLGEKTSGSAPEEIMGTFVSDNFMSSLGGSARLGRFFTPDENRVAGRDAVVVLSHQFWQRRFAGDPQIVGQKLLLNGKPFTVIGVANPDFIGLQMEAPDVWVPLMMRAAMATVFFEEVGAENRDWFGRQDFYWLRLHARLRPGKTAPEARAEVALLHGQLPRSSPAPDARATINVVPASRIRPDTSFWKVMGIVLGASGMVLLIACSNIANMSLARVTARRKEIGVRQALGAGRWRVTRQLLTESLMLAGLGGAAGVMLSWLGARLLLPWLFVRLGGGNFANAAFNLAPDWRVLSFSFLLSFLSGVAFGLIPALRAARPDLNAFIKGAATAPGGRAARPWLRNGLVVAQVALCFLLLIPAGLLLRALSNAFSLDPGFETKRLLIVIYSLELSGYDNARAKLFHQRLLERLAALPGVQMVSPNQRYDGPATITLPGDKQIDRALFRWVSSNYLETVGTPLARGRGFTGEEAMAKAPVLIVSETTARNLWPNENPLGKTLRLERSLRDGGRQIIFPAAQVVGVARDAQSEGAGFIPPLLLYAPQVPDDCMDTSILARTTGAAAATKELARKEAFALEPVLRFRTATMEEQIANDPLIVGARVASGLATALGGLALLLAAIGIYGVVAFSVAERTREIGIRMALGAQAINTQALVLKQGMWLVLTGVLIAAPVSVAVSQVLRSMLFGLSAIDPATYGGVALLLAVVAVLACLSPARRAVRVDPMTALRCE